MAMSKKHRVLEFIFEKYFNGNPEFQKSILFTLNDISEGYSFTNQKEPASISNTILDLVRKKKPITSRLPDSIIKWGYDLKKRTGPSKNGNLAGEFVYVGKGNEINSWLTWQSNFDYNITIDTNCLPRKINRYLRTDEGAIFSVMDYCDVLSHALNEKSQSIKRIQHPIKLQPNEIDGFYCNLDKNIIYPVEAKALSTKDDINLDQMNGGVSVVKDIFRDEIIIPLAVRMVKNALNIAEFYPCNFHSKEDNSLKVKSFINVSFQPKIYSWDL